METIKQKLGKVSITVEKEPWSENKEYPRLTVVLRESTNTCYISRKAVPIGTTIDNKEYWLKFSTLNQPSYEISQEFGDSPELGISQKTLTEAYNEVKEEIEEITSDKPYSPETFSGLGKVYLKKNVVEDKNILTQDMLTETNTIYYIQYDYDLNGETITVPDDCVLQFEGGSISNGTVNGQNTALKAGDYDNVLINVLLTGTFNNNGLSICYFGVKKGKRFATDNSFYINNYVKQSFESVGCKLIVPQGSFYYDEPIVFNGKFDIDCIGTLRYCGENNAVALTIGEGTNSSYKFYRIRLQSENNQRDYYNVDDPERTVPESYGLKLLNIATSEIHLDDISGFAYDVTLQAYNGKGFVYNNIYINRIGGTHYVALTLQGLGGWINENLYIGGRLQSFGSNPFRGENTAIRIYSDDYYSANNVFLKPCFEVHYIGFDCDKVKRTYAYNCRFENVTICAKFRKNCSNNVFTGNNITGSVIDEGTSNFVKYPVDVYKTTFKEESYSGFIDMMKIKTSEGIYSNLAQYGFGTILPNGTLYRDYYLGVGFVVDCSIAKKWTIRTEAHSSIVIAPLDDNNNLIDMENIEAVFSADAPFTYRSATDTSKGFTKGEFSTTTNLYPVNGITITFTDNVNKVYIGGTPVGKKIEIGTKDNISSYISYPGVLENVSGTIESSDNIPNGFIINNTNNNITIPHIFNGTSFVGLPVDITDITRENRPSNVPNGSIYHDPVLLETQYYNNSWKSYCNWEKLVETINWRATYSGGFASPMYKLYKGGVGPDYEDTSTVTGVGYVVDVSKIKVFKILSTSARTSNALRLHIAALGDNLENLTYKSDEDPDPEFSDIVDYTNSPMTYSNNYGCFRANHPAKATIIAFKDNVSKVFIGIQANYEVKNNIALYAKSISFTNVLSSNNISYKELLLEPYDNTIIDFIPTGNWNVPTGLKLYSTAVNKFITYNGTNWLEEDGVIAGTLRSGTTNERPIAANIHAGFQYIDTTLNKPIWFNGTDWVDATGATV